MYIYIYIYNVYIYIYIYYINIYIYIYIYIYMCMYNCCSHCTPDARLSEVAYMYAGYTNTSAYASIREHTRAYALAYVSVLQTRHR
jgi:hypothetical protein